MTGELRPRWFFDESEAGILRYSARQWPTPRAGLVLLLLLLGLPLLVLLAGGPTALWGTLGGDLFLLLLAGSGLLERCRIYDRALVVGPTWPGAVPYVIPLETIDPAHVRLWHRANLLARSQPDASLWTRRAAIYTSIGITFEGLSPAAAHARRRDAAVARLGLRPSQTRYDPVAEHGFPGPGQRGLPTSNWLLGTSRPEPLLRALEAALVSSGRVDARGLADRELRDPAVAPWKRAG